MIERQRDQGFRRKKLKTHFYDSPDEDDDHERRSHPTQSAQPSNPENSRDHHQDSAEERENRQREMCSEVELDGAGKKSGLHTKPADEGKGDAKGDEDGADSSE